MSVIIRLQNLSWAASALDIRQFFHGLSIPDGGVHIIGGEMGDAFIAFSTDEDARQAMMLNGRLLNECAVRLLLSSKTEMQNVIASARAKKTSPEENTSLVDPSSYDQFQNYTAAPSARDNDYPNYYQQQREADADVIYREQLAPTTDVRLDSVLGYHQDRPRVDRFSDESHDPLYQSNEQTLGARETSIEGAVQNEWQSAANYKQRQTMYGMQYTRESDNQKERGYAGQFSKQSSYNDDRVASTLFDRQSFNKLNDRQGHQFPRQQTGPMSSHFPRDRTSEADARDSQRLWHGRSEDLNSPQQSRNTRLNDDIEYRGNGKDDIHLQNDPRGLQRLQHTPGLLNTPSDHMPGVRDPRLGPQQTLQAERNRGDQLLLSDDYNRPPHSPDFSNRGPVQDSDDIGTALKKLPSLLGNPGGFPNRPDLNNQPSPGDRRREMSRHEEVKQSFSVTTTPNRNDGGPWKRQTGSSIMRNDPSNNRNHPFVGGPRDGPPFDGSEGSPHPGSQTGMPPNRNSEEQKDFDWEHDSPMMHMGADRMRREGRRDKEISSSGDGISVGRGGPQLGRDVPLSNRSTPLLDKDSRHVSMGGWESNLDRDGVQMRGNEQHGAPMTRDGKVTSREGSVPRRGVGPRDRLPVGTGAPVFGRDGVSMLRDGPPLRRDGPPLGRDGPPMERSGLPVGRSGSPVARDGPPMRRDRPLMDRDGPPVRRDDLHIGGNGPPVERGDLPLGRGGQPTERDGVSLRDNLPLGRDEPSMRRDGPLLNRGGRFVGRDVQTNRSDGSLLTNRASDSMNRDGDGPLMRRGRSPTNINQQLRERDNLPVGRDLLPSDRGAPQMERSGSHMSRSGLPLGRDDQLIGRGDPQTGRREGPPMGRAHSLMVGDGPPMGRDEPLIRREGLPMGRDGPRVGRSMSLLGRDGLPMRSIDVEVGNGSPMDKFDHSDKDIRSGPPELGNSTSQRKGIRPLLDRDDLHSVQHDESKGGLVPLLPTPDRSPSARRNQQGPSKLSPSRKLLDERSDRGGLLPAPDQDRSHLRNPDPGRRSSDRDRRSSDHDRRGSDRSQRSTERDKRRDRSPRKRSRSRDRSDLDKNERSNRRRARSPSTYAKITGVHPRANYRDIRRFFGGVVITNIKMYNLDTKKYPDGFALLKFPFERDLQRAIGFSGERLHDKALHVQRCSAEDYENGDIALKSEDPSPAKKPKESSSSRSSDSKTNDTSSSCPSDSKANSSSSRPSDSKPNISLPRSSESKPDRSSSRPSNSKMNSGALRTPDSKTNVSSSLPSKSKSDSSSSRTSDSKNTSSSEDGTWIVLDNLPFRVNKSDVFTFFKGFELIPSSLYIPYVKNNRENGSIGTAYLEFKTPAARKRSLGLHQTNKIGDNVIGIRAIEKEEAKKCIESGPDIRPEKTVSKPVEGNRVTQSDQTKFGKATEENPALAASAKSSEPLLETPQIKQLPKLKPLVPIASNKPTQPKPGVLPTPSRSEVNLDRFVANRCMVGMKNLPPPVTVNNVIGFLREFQPIAETARLNFNHNGLPTGEAMVAFATPATASNVIRQKNNSVINGHVIMVFLVT